MNFKQVFRIVLSKGKDSYDHISNDYDHYPLNKEIEEFSFKIKKEKGLKSLKGYEASINRVHIIIDDND